MSDTPRRSCRRHSALSVVYPLTGSTGSAALGLIFATPHGRPIALNTVYGAFKRDILRQSLVDLSPHSLRHTIITLWLDAGVPVHHVAAWAGHANPTVTMRVYAHVLKRKQEEMAGTTERALWGEKQKEDAV